VDSVRDEAIGGSFGIVVSTSFPTCLHLMIYVIFTEDSNVLFTLA